jgi:hypothetical protein
MREWGTRGKARKEGQKETNVHRALALSTFGLTSPAPSPPPFPPLPTKVFACIHRPRAFTNNTLNTRWRQMQGVCHRICVPPSLYPCLSPSLPPSLPLYLPPSLPTSVPPSLPPPLPPRARLGHHGVGRALPDEPPFSAG